MFEQRLRRELEQVARRIRRNRLWFSLAMVWLLVAVAGVVAWSMTPNLPIQSQQLAVFLLCLATVAGIVTLYMVRMSTQDLSWVAQLVEQKYPDLDSRLMTAVEQEPESGRKKLGYLQECVVKEALKHSYEHPWTQALSTRRWLITHLFHGVSLAAMGGALVALLMVTPTPVEAKNERHSVAIIPDQYEVRV